MYIKRARPGEQINIGREGEHKARQVQFDISPWIGRYGEGNVELIYQRPGDDTIYPVAVERQDNYVLWTITNTDTANAGGFGVAELRYYVGDALVKSEKFHITVSDAMGEPGEIPDPPGQSWLDQALAAGQSAQDGAARSEAAEARIEDAIGQAAWIGFELGESGELVAVLSPGANADFALDEEGNLEVILNA